MSFVHECNKNNGKDTKRDKFTRHNKIINIGFGLFVNSLTILTC